MSGQLQMQCKNFIVQFLVNTLWLSKINFLPLKSRANQKKYEKVQVPDYNFLFELKKLSLTTYLRFHEPKSLKDVFEPAHKQDYVIRHLVARIPFLIFFPQCICIKG